MSDLAAELDQLPLQIHEAALEPDLWDDVLASIIRLVDARCGNLMVFEARSPAPALYLARNIDPEAERLFETYWYQHDLWLRAGSLLPAPSVVIGQEMVPERDLLGSAFYNDFLKRENVGRVLTNLFTCGSPIKAHLSTHRATTDAEFAQFECTVMQRLAPHLATAIRVHVRLSGLANRLRATEAALDRLPIGLCLIDQAGKILHRNALAESILAANDGLGMWSGSLRAAATGDSRQLAARIAEAVATGLGRATMPGAVLSIGRPSLRRPYSVLVAPLNPTRDRTTGLIGETRPCAIVLLSDPEQEPCYPADVLGRRYRLTIAEARLACAIVAGSSLQDAADQFGIAVGTARNQLKRIFAKAEVTRQSELVRLLTADLAAQAAQLVPDRGNHFSAWP